jgi:putative chitinase
VANWPSTRTPSSTPWARAGQHPGRLRDRHPAAHCALLAQTCHESAGFRTTEEFASGQAYEGRKDLGNTHTGDGVRYKGRGLLQLTGRANYREMGQRLGLPLEDQPELAAEPVLSLKIACEFWRRKAINPCAMPMTWWA